MDNTKGTEILLSVGTNELEIMEFTINDEIFGINVAKVKEIMRISPLKNMQKSHDCVEGIFKPRGEIITVIDLAKYLNLNESEHQDRDIFIITNFNNRDFAFHVHTVVGIDRISWQDMKKPDSIIYGGDEGIATGIAQCEGRLVTILDFEKIVSEISPEVGIQVSDVESLSHRERNDKKIMVVEDSALLSKMIIDSLHRSGYSNIIKMDNGKEAWDYLSDIRDSGEDIREQVACMVTDIEMPQMDGHHLTKLVKDDAKLKEIPIIIFSSLINEEMRRKGEQVGANEQISKPEILMLVNLIDKLTGRLK